MDEQERYECEKIVKKLLNNIKTEGVNDFDNISFHRSFYDTNLEVKKNG